jgi:hypothetical protein
MAGNYALRGILAALPEDAPLRQLRLLVALETVKADAGGWRDVSMTLLADYARISQPTARQARDELATAGLLEYKLTGRGRHAQLLWRILAPERLPSRVKDRVSPEDQSQVKPLSPSGESSAFSGETPNALTSGDAAPSSSRALERASSSARARAREQLRAAGYDLDEDQTQAVLDLLRSRGAQKVLRVLRTEISSGEIAETVEQALTAPGTWQDERPWTHDPKAFDP